MLIGRNQLALLALLAVSPATGGCWDWERFEEGGDAAVPRDTSIDADANEATDANADADADGTSDGGTCSACACAGDTCVGGMCVPARPVRGMALGAHFACFVVEDGSVYCLGDNESGQLGTGALSDGEARPVRAMSSTPFMSAYAGDRFVALLDATGAAYLWGARPPDDVATPTATPLGMTFEKLAAGSNHLCGLAEQVLWCMGDNAFGQLGTGDTEPLSGFVGVSEPWLEVGAGLAHTCAVRPLTLVNGELWCWGRNDRGQLGTGDRLDSAPRRVGTGDNWRRAEGGTDFTCGTRFSDVNVYCWGRNDSQQTGNAGSSDILEPGGLVNTDTIDFAVGSSHACVVRDPDGSIACWGDNACGAQGTGTRITSETPRTVRMDDLERHGPWTDVEAGNHVTCAIRENGSLWCWGRRASLMVDEDSTCGVDDALVPERICL